MNEVRNDRKEFGHKKRERKADRVRERERGR